VGNRLNLLHTHLAGTGRWDVLGGRQRAVALLLSHLYVHARTGKPRIIRVLTSEVSPLSALVAETNVGLTAMGGDVATVAVLP